MTSMSAIITARPKIVTIRWIVIVINTIVKIGGLDFNLLNWSDFNDFDPFVGSGLARA